MSRKLLMATSGLFGLAIFAGTAFISTSSAASAPVPRVFAHKPAGLTAQGIANARRSGLPSNLVAMAPQSSVALLKRKATRIGPHALDAHIQLIIGLKLRHEPELKAFLQQVQDPASPQYHQWLTPAQFTARYGPSKAQLARVVKFLKGRGITIEAVSSNRVLIHTEATTETYDRAFGIGINDYKLNERSFYSTTDSPKLPRDVAPLVANIMGLNHGVRMHPHSHFKPATVASSSVRPDAAPSPSMNVFNPHQIATAYDWPSIADSANGAGVTIGIVTAESATVSASDYDGFWRSYDLPEHALTIVPVGGPGLSNSGAMGETLLDIEWSGAMAPGAAQIVYNAADTYFSTFTEAYNQLVEDNNVQVMTTSWGYCDAGIAWTEIETDEAIFAQAAAQGISMFAAAGDAGAADSPCQGGNPYNNANYPSSSAYVVAANGTELFISDLSGTYAHENVWDDPNCSPNGVVATGGGISSVISRPAWQRGLGVPTDVDTRMNSDLAMNASCSHSLYTYIFGGWSAVYGTSAVAPMLAGLFAIGVSQRGKRLGQANTLIYNDANSSNYGADFHDVTGGCNGLLPGGTAPSCASAGWDHPTGWGSPKATSLLAHLGIQGNKGTLGGTVTDAVSGATIKGATVVVTGGNDQVYDATTGEDGTYSLTLPSGDFTVTVSDFGYADGSASISISEGNTTTRDFTLSAAPRVALSGKVSDGSGHGYGLYADIKISTARFGQIADVWTDPETGKYSIKLPKGATYTMNVAAAFDGYNTASKTVALSGAKSENFPLTVTDTCTAPGYRFVTGGLSADFNGSAFPPDGWTVTNPDSGPVVWELTSEVPGSGGYTGNYTGGTGTAAVADSTSNNPNNSPFDTSLVTPPIAVTSLHGATVLRYKANYRQWSTTEALDLDITTDGGANWTNILHWTTSYGGFFALPGYDEQLDLSSYLPASGDFQLRWRYYNPPGGFVEYAMLDDVVIGACKPIPGGFVMGQVSDAETGDGIPGALVSDGKGITAQAQVNSADPNLPIAFYIFFDAPGKYTLSASAGHYSPQTAQVTLPNNGVVRRNLSLKSARFGVNPGRFSMNVMVNSSATASFVLSNSGGAAGRFHVIGINAPPPRTSRSQAVGAGTPLIRVPVGNTAWVRASGPWIEAHTDPRTESTAAPKAFRRTATSLGSRTQSSTWRKIANYPEDQGINQGIAGNTAARDPATGKIYATDGYYFFYGPNSIQTAYPKSAYVYDPETDSWSSIADTPRSRIGPASGFINGRYYVVDGEKAEQLATVPYDPVAELDIYDPTTNTWSTGRPNPSPAGKGSGYAVMNGLLYIVGGCEAVNCASATSAVQVYDPRVNTWSSVAPYPSPVAYLSCGGISGKLYCAGGLGFGQGSMQPPVGNGYVYDPASNRWSPIASMTIPLAGSFYTAANGLLIVAGGSDATSSGVLNIVNESEAYDPRTDSWMPLPNMPVAAAKGAHACGMYQLGGIAQAGRLGSVALTGWSDELPGYAPCDESPGIPWLTPAPASGTLDAGASAKVMLAFDGTGQEAFTTTKAYLDISNDSPYGTLSVPVTVHWVAQPVSLRLTGNASPTSVRKGGNLTYSLTVKNAKVKNHGAATQTMLTYALPDGVSYVVSSGDADCTSPATSSSPAPEVATGGQPRMVSCDFGTLAQGASKTVTIAVKANQAGKLDSHFEVSSREPNDSDKSTLDIHATVIGIADVSASGSNATISEGTDGTIKLAIANSGPDSATDVQFKVSAGGNAKLTGATSSQGSCTASGNGAFTCDIGELEAGGKAEVTLTVFGTSAGTATVQGQALTSSDDSDQSNNVATATVTVKAASNGGGGNNGGGGALGWIALAALLGLALAGAGVAKARKS